jgi:hypothetical protein
VTLNPNPQVPVWVTSSFPLVNLSVILHASSAPSGLKIAVSPSMRSRFLGPHSPSAVSSLVFVKPQEFNLKVLPTERPDFELIVSQFPGSVELRRSDVAWWCRLG